VVHPWISERYRVKTGKDNMGILGSSLGGIISCYAAWTMSSVWGKAGCLSSSFWWNDQDFSNDVMQKTPPPTLSKIYLDSGDCCPSPDSDSRKDTLAVLQHMEQLGFKQGENVFYYLDRGGQHNEYYWGKRFHLPMASLYPVKTTLPTGANMA